MMVIGAGLSGLIAGYYFDAQIFEMQNSLPNNHHAILRFKTDIISKITNIPFKKVFVRKGIVHEGNYLDKPNIYVCNEYSLKVSGAINSQRSIWNTEPGYRYISPPDFIQQLANKCTITYGSKFGKKEFMSSEVKVSTIPMPLVLRELEIPSPEFTSRISYIITCNITKPQIDMYQTLYFPSLIEPFYRASLTGNQLIIELVENIDTDEVIKVVEEVIEYFGVPKGLFKTDSIKYQEQQYGKIVNIADDTRKSLMWGLTRDYNIYSLGRYATWRPILLDDLAKDLQVIRSLISMEDQRRGYHQSLRMTRQ